MLLEDFRTIAGIRERKYRVKAWLGETAEWCRPGLWYIEGPYARHEHAVLPDHLHNAIRAIRKRKLVRELVERLVPPWHARVLHGESPAPGNGRCSIGYVSNGGSWKLFDLDGGLIWTCSTDRTRMKRETETLQRFGKFFNVPAWRTVPHGDTIWRSDAYIPGGSMAVCSPALRRRVFETLLEQYAAYARASAAPPQPEFTQAAFKTIGACAPDSLPARILQKHLAQMEFLGSRMPFLPAHGDLNAYNVFVADGNPWIIDWDNAGHLLPASYDVLYLITQEVQLGRLDLVEALLRGCFDEALDRVLGAGGPSIRRCDAFIVLVYNYLMHFHAIRRAGHRDARRENVDALWNPLHEICRPYL